MSTDTMLPILSSIGGVVTQQVLKTMAIENVDDNTSNNFTPRQRQFLLKGFLPPAKRNINTSRYRNSLFHNLCLDMLQDGFHLAFCELFNLIKQQEQCVDSEEYFERTGKVQLNESEEKLHHLKEFLIAAELARRQGRADKVYEAQFTLAIFFDHSKDFDVAKHFYEACFKTSRQIHGDGGRKEAEANCNLAIYAQNAKNYKEASRYFEQYYFLTKMSEWKSQDGISLHEQACDHLQAIYVILSEQLPKENQEDILWLLHKAHKITKEGGDEKKIGKMGYLIGNTYDLFGDQQSAVKYHTEYFHLSQSTNDDIGMGKACQALANANLRQGNFGAAIDNLKQFLRVTEETDDREGRREACSNLAAVYNCMGNYEQSTNFYKRSFELSETLGDSATIIEASCEYAIALAHGLFTAQAQQFSQNNKESVNTLLSWKGERVQDNGTFELKENVKQHSSVPAVSSFHGDKNQNGSSAVDITLQKETEG